MTREDAIKTLKELWRETNDPWYEEVYNMAINALEADRKDEPTISKMEQVDKDINVRSKDEPQKRCGNCKFLTYRFNKVWCDIKCENPHDMVCDKWAPQTDCPWK